MNLKHMVERYGSQREIARKYWQLDLAKDEVEEAEAHLDRFILLGAAIVGATEDQTGALLEHVAPTAPRPPGTGLGAASAAPAVETGARVSLSVEDVSALMALLGKVRTRVGSPNSPDYLWVLHWERFLLTVLAGVQR